MRHSDVHKRQHGAICDNLAKWVPHMLTERDRERRVDAAWSLLSYRRATAWLDSIVTADEKCLLYENVPRKLQWVDADQQPEPVVKRDLHPRKVMLCISGDQSVA